MEMVTGVTCQVANGRERETGKNWGLRRFLQLRITGEVLHAGIPTAKCVSKVFIQNLRAHLQLEVRSALAPTHLLFLHHPLTDHIVHSRFHECRRDRFSMTVPIAVIRDEGFIGADVIAEFLHCL